LVIKNGIVVRNVERADARVVKRLAATGVATVHEAAGRTGLLHPYLRPIYPNARAAGTAVTVLCQPGDNLMVHLAVECCRPGDLLVVAVSSASTDGFIGELLATSLRAQGVTAVVIDAGVRDVAVLREMEFPVWARGVSAQGTVKATAGAVNVPVVCAGQLIEPGDPILADDDGIVRVPALSAADVADRAEARVRYEAQLKEKLASGEFGADLYGLRDVALREGIVYVDGATAAEGYDLSPLLAPDQEAVQDQ
jgi:4-hydroxy-4-methyl-2-oxoglutarate aldolase